MLPIWLGPGGTWGLAEQRDSTPAVIALTVIPERKAGAAFRRVGRWTGRGYV